MSTQQLLKILIGAAWLDGKIQPSEQEYLRRIAQSKGLLEDPELKPWLYGLRAVSATECSAWVNEYLGQHPTPEQCQDLLESISGLIYSDGDVDSAEAQLMMQVQQIESNQSAPMDIHTAVTRSIQNLYRRWVSP